MINSNVTIIDTEIRNSNSEDAINIVSSQSYIKNLKLSNISADALDIDFGKVVFEKAVESAKPDLNVSFLSKGIYIASLTTGRKQMVKKLVIN